MKYSIWKVWDHYNCHKIDKIKFEKYECKQHVERLKNECIKHKIFNNNNNTFHLTCIWVNLNQMLKNLTMNNRLH